MRKVVGSVPAAQITPTESLEPSAPITKAKVSVDGAPVGAKSDLFNLKDPELNEGLKQLRGDAATITRVLPTLDSKVVILGTARSKPVPGENGFFDYVFVEKVGESLRTRGMSVGTGGGPGNMEAALRGHAIMSAVLEMRARREAAAKGIGWNADEPMRQGANIILPHEQGANAYVPTKYLASFEKFLFRMEFLFRNTRDFVATPGGFGTVAETFTFLAMKAAGAVGDPVVFGAPDDFYVKHNAAFSPLLYANERGDLGNIFDDPEALADFVQKMPDTVAEEDVGVFVARMLADLEEGFRKLDGKPPAIVFFGGEGEQTKASAAATAEIAEAMAKQGSSIRVGGSKVMDQAVLAGAQKANPDVQVQGFAMANAQVEDGPGVDYTKVHDVLVLREMLSSNVKGLVVSPEGAKQIAMLFTSLTDMQTGEMPKVPVVVLDPEGKFQDVKQMLHDTMLTNGRQYINPEDLDLFTITNDPKKAIEILNRA